MNSKNSAVLRVTANICFFFTVLSVFTVYEQMWPALALYAALCLAVGFAAVRCGNALLRFLLALIPTLAFLLVIPGLSLQLLLLAFPALAVFYYVWVMSSGRFAVPLDEYRRTFTMQLVVALFFIAANIVDTTLYKAKHVSMVSIAFVLVFLLIGVYTLRVMQMGASMDMRWQASNFLTIVGVPTVSVAVATLFFLLLRFSEPVLRFLFRPIGRLLSLLMLKLFPDTAENFSLPERPEISMPTSQVPYVAVDDLTTENIDDGEPNGLNPLLVERLTLIGAYVVLAIIFAITLYLIAKGLRKRLRYADENEQIFELTEAERSSVVRRGGRRAKRAPVIGNAGQIRRIYLLYLEFMQKHGLSVYGSNTSEELLDEAQKIRQSPEAVRLRELYIAARYGEGSAITRAQVEEAQRCLDAITAETPAG